MKSIERMGEEGRLDEVLADLRREESHVKTPARVEAAVMSAWDANQSLVGAAFTRTDVASVRTWQSVAALAAGVVLTIALSHLGEELRNAAVRPADGATASLLFVGAPILEDEDVRIVRMKMAASTLANLGIRTTVHDPDAAVDVDVIVGEDGVARAIRY